MNVPLPFWIAFNLFVLAMLALDLGVFHRRAHQIGLREAAWWSAFWIALGLLFGLGVYRYAGPHTGLEYLTGYLLEKSLSVDNLFVFVMIFGAFAVPATYQHRVLFWGILGALVMRGALILAGAYLIERFHWVTYLFGLFVLVTGLRMAVQRQQDIDIESNWIVNASRRYLRITGHYRGARLLVRSGGRLWATPLLVVLLVVEFTDLMFAMDSIPAIFAVTKNPFIVYTSNVFAILGLRSLYFLLAGCVDRFRYLRPALAVILVFVGAKMLLADVYRVPIALSLAFIGLVLSLALIGSLAFQRTTGSTGEPVLCRPANEPKAE